MKRHGEIIVSYLWENFHITVDVDESGWEGVQLHHEEIDRALIPEEDLRTSESIAISNDNL